MLCWRSLGPQARTVWSAVRARASSRFASQSQPRSTAHTRRPPDAPDRARPSRRRTRGFDRDGRIRPSDRRPHGPPPRLHARRHILRSGRPWRGQTGRTSSVPIAAAPLGGAQVSFRIGLDQCLHLDRVLGRWGQPARPPALFSVSLVCSPDGLLAVSESGQLSGPLSCLRSSPLLSCQAGGLGPAPSACFICRSEPGRESARTRRSRSVELEVERGERCAECRHGEFVSVPSACDRVDHKASLPGVTRSQVLTGERHARLSCR